MLVGMFPEFCCYPVVVATVSRHPRLHPAPSRFPCWRCICSACCVLSHAYSHPIDIINSRIVEYAPSSWPGRTSAMRLNPSPRSLIFGTLYPHQFRASMQGKLQPLASICCCDSNDGSGRDYAYTRQPAVLLYYKRPSSPRLTTTAADRFAPFGHSSP